MGKVAASSYLDRQEPPQAVDTAGQQVPATIQCQDEANGLKQNRMLGIALVDSGALSSVSTGCTPHRHKTVNYVRLLHCPL